MIQLMVAMGVRAFPRTQREPKKRILLIPIFLMIGGLLLNMAHPYFRFIGTVIALAGSLSVFLVGMVFADLWVAHKRTKDIIKAREERGLSSKRDEDLVEDPFMEALDED